MLKFVILLSVVACAFGAALPEGLLPQLDGRIVGGSATSISSFPWQVSVQHKGVHMCGGSVYSNRFIVTAAHCLDDIDGKNLRVRAGSSHWYFGGVVREVADFWVHPEYIPATSENDIAVLNLISTLPFSDNIKAISLASSSPANGAAASVSGWGSLLPKKAPVSNYASSQLRYVNVNIISQSICASKPYGYGKEITSSMICARAPGKDACGGDSGGPLVSGGVLVGVVSWGYGCAQAKYPGIYADVAVLRSWVLAAVDAMT